MNQRNKGKLMMKKYFKTLLYLAVFVFLAQFAFAYNVVKLSPEYFPNTSIGRALGTASIYVGTPDLDPTVVANQKTLSVQQEDGTIVAVTQPIYTSAGGVPTYLGSPVTLLVDGDYSLTVLDSNGSQIYYVPSVLYYTPLTTPYGRYLVDYTEVDQGAVGSGNSVYDIIAEVGAVTRTTMYFAHNSGAATTTYTFTTNEVITDNFNIIVENGVIFDGAGTLTLDNPNQIAVQPRQYVFANADIVSFTNGGEVFPQWWGALGNGVQDDTVYFNSAADSITSGVLRVLTGNYILNSRTAYTSANTSGTLYGQIILNNNISMKGDGLGSRLTCTLDAVFYATIVVNGTNDTIIEGLYIVGTGTAVDAAMNGGGIRVELSGKTIVRDNYIDGTRGVGINFVGNSGGNAGSTGVANYCAYTHTSNNTVIDSNGDGIYHIYSKYATIDNNILDSCGYTDAIILEAADHSTVTSNVVITPHQRGILINTGSSYTTIDGNTLYHQDAVTVYDSIYLASVRHCIVSNNVIRYAAAGANPQSAIVMIPGLYAWADTYHNITGNQIYNAGATEDITAIHVQTSYNTIQNNKVSGSTYGISVEDSAYNVIQYNDLRCSGQEIRLVGIDGRDNPTYTYVIGNYIQTSAYDASTYSQWRDNFPDEKELTTGSPQLLLYDKWIVGFTLDSVGGAITGNLKDGSYVGQIVTIVMTEETTSSTISIDKHQTTDPEVATFDAIDETGVFMWTGTEWITIFATCTF